MKIYKLRRRRDGLFLGGKDSKAVDKHDHIGRFYLSEFSAVRAIEMSGRKLEEYDLIVYDLVEVGVVDYQEVLAEV